MKRSLTSLLPPILALVGLSVCCIILWNQTARFRRSVEKIAEDVRVSLIDLNGKVVYDSTGQDLPNHSDRAEFEAVKADGRARSVVRESDTLHIAMFYHARRVGDYVLRIAVPYQSVTEAKSYATYGLLAAIGIGALVILALYLFTRRFELRLSRLAAERDLQDKLLAEMRKLEEFRRDFISNVTHEVRTPVTGILGAVEILTDTSAKLDDADRTELQNVLKDQSVRLNALVDDILSLAQLEKAETENTADFEPFEVSDIVQNAVNLARPFADKAGITLLFSQSNTQAPNNPNTSLFRPCDPRLIESAITNLIQNAVRYSGSAQIEIKVAATENGKASVSVIDQGVGIAPEYQPRLFERFYRVDKNRSRALGGTGLGLAIVKHIVQLHRGEVSVVSSPGHGATFTIVF